MAASSTGTGFLHPGLLHTADDFIRMQQKVVTLKASPWIDGWNTLLSCLNTYNNLSWQPHAQSVVYRGSDGVHAENYSTLMDDIAVAYMCALYWKVSGDTAYADKAVQIMNAWSSTLTGIGGDITGFLVSGIQGYQFANVGEIMRTYSGWKAADFAAFQAMMLNIFYPQNHQGLSQSLAPLTVYSSWQLCCMASMLAIGVLCDRQDLFDEAVNYFKGGLGNGGLAQTVYYIHPGYLGQTQESGRDQGHNTLSISLLTTLCEMAWNQGRDLYGYDNNRVLAAAEYVAKGNLIQSGSTYYTVPFEPYNVSVYGSGSINDTAFSAWAQGNQRPEWAMIYNHYVNRQGLAAPYTQAFAMLMQPEGGGTNGQNSGSFDQLGYGTLTFTRDAPTTVAAPSGLTAIVSAGQVVLSWWGVAQATSYTVMRSTTRGKSYQLAKGGVTDLLTYTDSGLAPGTYYYVVTAETTSGTTAASNEAVAITVPQLQTYLAFDDGSSTSAADSSGNGNVGTLVGGVTWAAGKIGKAVSLDGSSGYVSLPTGVVASLSDFTIAAWVYWNAASNWERVFDFGTGVDQYMMLTPRSGSGTARFAITLTSGGGEQVINSPAALPTGQWTHVAVSLSENIGTLYVNGSAVGTNTAMSFAPFRLGNTSQNWIGRSQYPDPYFNGLIDEFRIYTGVLGADQIAALYSAGQ
ncbi:Alginate lyase [Burkholderia sp. OK233]|nr:Alginate lyase [Burkholderia sp. OK233]